jgi:hypothetical protein
VTGPKTITVKATDPKVGMSPQELRDFLKELGDQPASIKARVTFAGHIKEISATTASIPETSSTPS